MEDAIQDEDEDSFQRSFMKLGSFAADRQHNRLEESHILHEAAKRNSLLIVTLILSTNPNTNARNLEGWAALHIAADSRCENAPEIITALIHHGADVNMRDATQWLPLHRAVNSRAVENALRLIDNGAEVNAVVPDVGATIYLALDAIQDSPPTALAMVSNLLSAGADPNSRDYHGNTPLHRVRQLQSQIVDRLLEAGADPNAQDYERKTPLHKAVTNDEYLLARTLYNAGGDPTAVDKDGATPEALAADREYHDSFEALFNASRTSQKPKFRLLYQQARPFEMHPVRREVCAEFRGSFWYIKTPVDAKENFKSSEYDDYGKPRVSCSPLAEPEDESSTPGDVTCRQLTRATPTVYDMLYSDALLNGFKVASGPRWIHLPFTVKLWIDHLIEAIARITAHGNSSLPRTDNDSAASGANHLGDSADIKRFISETFNETGLVAGYRQPGLVFKESPGKQAPHRVSLVLPLIDVDYSITEMTRVGIGNGVRGNRDERNQTHIQTIRKLQGSYDDDCCRLHFPRTLDESSYDFLETDDLKRRDQSQVLTVYLEGKRALAEAESSTPASTRRLLGQAVPKSREGAREHLLWRTLKNEKSAAPSASAGQENDGPIRTKMLMVPQLWLWKLDEHTIISAYPERWDAPCGQSMFDKVRRELQFCTTVDDAISKIADTCVNYIQDSWYVSKGKSYTTFDAFDQTIAEASNEVTKCYEEFETSVGSANKNIHLQVHRGAGILKKISDVVDEIGIIKRVLNDQALVMTSILRWRSQTDGPDRAEEAKYMHHPLERFNRLEQNASSVQSSLITLLDIWQRESIIDDAREESRQSRVLFVFTAVTVCFLPLSFIGQVLALPMKELDRDPGEHFAASWVLEVEGKYHAAGKDQSKGQVS
ncbi:hypothetical protein ASPCAL08548 [Aspergillus calidoustus]|uniref:Uncharacterized protein n=1 Tax=Aspergillus calidoustus TaxID=454130 RepID=A0A0U5GRT6_ASPCI|nr:hypothetical protein ASPCAL08548 [Aspergillus calidoustus]